MNRSTHICYLTVWTSINGSEWARRRLSDLDAGDAATQDRVESALVHVEFRMSGGEADWNRYHQHSPESITHARCWPDTSKEITKSGRVTGQGSSRPVVTPLMLMRFNERRAVTTHLSTAYACTIWQLQNLLEFAELLSSLLNNLGVHYVRFTENKHTNKTGEHLHASFKRPVTSVQCNVDPTCPEL